MTIKREKYYRGDIVEVINSDYPTMKDVERAGGQCSMWLSMKMKPPIVGMRFRVMHEYKGFGDTPKDNVVVDAGSLDRFGKPTFHILPKSSIMLYNRSTKNRLMALLNRP
jgi:hypothetical protein